jgi:hypothetical protein
VFALSVVGGVFALSPALAVVFGLRIVDDLDDADTRSLYIVSAATNGAGSLGMILIAGLLGAGVGGGGLTGVLVGAILLGLVNAGIGAGTVWISDWAERPPAPRGRPAAGREPRGERYDEPRDERYDEPRDETRDDRAPR